MYGMNKSILKLAVITLSIIGTIYPWEKYDIFFKASDIFKSPIEYRIPFTYNLIDFKTGFLFMPSVRSSLRLDSTETEFPGFNNFNSRFLIFAELEPIKYNILNRLFKQNFIDILIGVGFFYGVGPSRVGLPSHWHNKIPVSGHEMFFKSEAYGFKLTQSFIYQLSYVDIIFTKLDYASLMASFYRNIEGKKYLTTTGNLLSISFGYRRLSSQEYESGFRNSIGIEFRLNFDKMKEVNDKYNISPIDRIKLNSISLLLSVSFLKGGKPTVGDEGRKLYISSNYSLAKAKFLEFIKNYPEHPKVKKAEYMIELCNDKISTIHIDSAVSKIYRGENLKALEHLQSACVSKNPEILRQVDSISLVAIKKFEKELDNLLDRGNFDEASKGIELVLKSKVKGSAKYTRKYIGYYYLKRGELLAKYGIWGRATEYFEKAVRSDPSLKPKVNAWLKKVAEGYLSDAEALISEKNIELAIEYLKKASKISDDIKPEIQDVVDLLQIKIENERNAVSREQLNKYRAKIVSVTSMEMIDIGMTNSEILKIAGEPIFKSVVEDRVKNEYSLWIYYLLPEGELHLYFQNGILFAIEKY